MRALDPNANIQITPNIPGWDEKYINNPLPGYPYTGTFFKIFRLSV
jgi:hypothetical protein